MKNLSFLLLLVGMTSLAQIKGNKDIVTTTIEFQNLFQLEMNLYASVTVNVDAANEGMTITADRNLISLIDTEVVNGKLRLTQLDWIQPSQDIKITINAPQLNSILVDVHETVEVVGVASKEISLTAILGKIKVYGTVNSLQANAESGIVDASNLEADEATLSIWDDGKVIVNAKRISTNELSKEARVSSINDNAVMNSRLKKALERENSPEFVNAEYITVKIKNNSWNRQSLEVKGPKKDGSYFGYGFPIMPGGVKKERWTVGTKVYKKTALGSRKLLLTIQKEDANKTLKLFD